MQSPFSFKRVPLKIASALSKSSAVCCNRPPALHLSAPPEAPVGCPATGRRLRRGGVVSVFGWRFCRPSPNVIERLNREIRRRTRVVGSFPDGNSALMLVCARLRHVAGTQWGNKKYMNMKHLEAALEDASIAG